MSFWSKLWGNSDVVKEGMGMIRDAGDALFYTDEEKAKDAATQVTEGRKMIVAWMQATTGQNLARRLLAVAITFTWLLMYISSMIMNVVSVWVTPETADKLVTNALTIFNFADAMQGAVMLILAFYFAAPHMDKIVGSAMGKFNTKPKE